MLGGIGAAQGVGGSTEKDAMRGFATPAPFFVGLFFLCQTRACTLSSVQRTDTAMWLNNHRTVDACGVFIENIPKRGAFNVWAALAMQYVGACSIVLAATAHKQCLPVVHVGPASLVTKDAKSNMPHPKCLGS